MGSATRFLIIGGSDAGISAALRALELDNSTSITVLLADGYPNFSICGLPFFLSGETPDPASAGPQNANSKESSCCCGTPLSPLIRRLTPSMSSIGRISEKLFLTIGC